MNLYLRLGFKIDQKRTFLNSTKLSDYFKTYKKRHRVSSQSKVVEEEKSSDENRVPDEEFSASDNEAADDDGEDSKSNRIQQNAQPILQANDNEMDHAPGRRVQADSDSSQNDSDENMDHDEPTDDSDNDGDDDDNFPPCYPGNPFLPEQIPFVAYPEDTTRSSPSERNMAFNRMVQNNFVPFAKGLKGEAYRRRCNYEHQQIMGYVLNLNSTK